MNLTVEDVNDNSVTLTWDAPELVGPTGLDGYLVEHCKAGSRHGLYSFNVKHCTYEHGKWHSTLCFVASPSAVVSSNYHLEDV